MLRLTRWRLWEKAVCLSKLPNSITYPKSILKKTFFFQLWQFLALCFPLGYHYPIVCPLLQKILASALLMLRKYRRKGASEKLKHIVGFPSCCTLLLVLYLPVCISPGEEPLSRQKSRKPCLAPSQLAIHTQLEKLELSDNIYIIKSRATIEGKVYVKVSKVVLINVQSHQAWCVHLTSTTTLGGLIVCEARHSTLQGGGCVCCEGAAWAAPHHTEHGCGLLSNTGPARFSDTFSWPIFTYPLIALPTWHIPYNTPLLLSLFMLAVLTCSWSCPFLPLPIARQKGALPYPLSQHGAVPPSHPTAPLYMSPHNNKHLSFTPTSLPLQWKWQDDVVVSMGWPRAA